MADTTGGPLRVVKSRRALSVKGRPVFPPKEKREPVSDIDAGVVDKSESA